MSITITGGVVKSSAFSSLKTGAAFTSIKGRRLNKLESTVKNPSHAIDADGKRFRLAADEATYAVGAIPTVAFSTLVVGSAFVTANGNVLVKAKQKYKCAGKGAANGLNGTRFTLEENEQVTPLGNGVLTFA